ncbi:MAG: PPC domain-containing protein [Candidatus Omnitrophica bacterium]|nr:PPC domain-containing protein [Candidatus Omnitrophota bacterium]
MNKIFNILFIFLLLSIISFSQMNLRESSIGYVYPAGGQKGTTLEIIIGGQNLRSVKEIYFSTDKIKVEEINYIPSLTLPQKSLLTREIREIITSRIRGKNPDLEKFKKENIQLPEHPLLQNLENKTYEELKKIFELFLFPLRTEQIKRSIQEKVWVRINISKDVNPGVYELRLLTRTGFTNPLNFYISEVPEVKEKEKILDLQSPDKEVFEPPIIINGQITPSDTDKFYFRGKKGQNLIIELKAREIIPYMGDAVPGWFQGVLILYDSNGREIAYADDYYFNPDPVIFFKVPEDGEYIIEVRDALFRGREDFVYRLFIGEKPFVTHIFPAGGRKKTETTVSIFGWNLPMKNMEINTEEEGIYKTNIFSNGLSSNEFYYHISDLPEIFEKEPNDTRLKAQKIEIPVIINGIISKPKDIDMFKFNLPEGFKLVIEVYSRRLGFPLDSHISLIDSKGKILISNDDFYDKNFDFLTHHADSYIYYEIKEKGTYYLKIWDSQNCGGNEYVYRIRISSPNPDFSLFVFPSSLNLFFSGNIIPFYVYAVRKDGFDGEIKIYLKNAPEGIFLNGGRIPEGKNKVALTLSTATSFVPLNRPIPIKIEGVAFINGKEVRKEAKPAEEVMQAFAYFHLLPSSNLFFFCGRRFISPILTLLNENEIVKIPSGGSSYIKCRILQPLNNQKIILELKDPPEGISIGDIKTDENLLTFEIKVSDKLKRGFSDNLIIEIFLENISSQNKQQKISRGFLPSIMIEII